MLVLHQPCNGIHHIKYIAMYCDGQVFYASDVSRLYYKVPTLKYGINLGVCLLIFEKKISKEMTAIPGAMSISE